MIRGFRRSPAGAGQAPPQPVDANDAFDTAVALEQREDLTAAEETYAAADRARHAGAAVKLGVLLEERDDLAGAESAFRRADERGDATGAFHLAWLLQERGDVAGAEEAYRRAELRGHPAAGANLRVLLARRPAPPAPGPAARPAPPADAPAGAAAATAPAAAGRGARPPQRSTGLVRRTLTVVLPVAAFAAAFLVGVATRPSVQPRPRVAPTVDVSNSTVRLSPIPPVPPAAELVVKPPPRKPVKPPLGAVPLAGTPSSPATRGKTVDGTNAGGPAQLIL